MSERMFKSKINLAPIKDVKIMPVCLEGNIGKNGFRNGGADAQAWANGTIRISNQEKTLSYIAKVLEAEMPYKLQGDNVAHALSIVAFGLTATNLVKVVKAKDYVELFGLVKPVAGKDGKTEMQLVISGFRVIKHAEGNNTAEATNTTADAVKDEVVDEVASTGVEDDSTDDLFDSLDFFG